MELVWSTGKTRQDPISTVFDISRLTKIRRRIDEVHITLITLSFPGVSPKEGFFVHQNAAQEEDSWVLDCYADESARLGC